MVTDEQQHFKKISKEILSCFLANIELTADEAGMILVSYGILGVGYTGYIIMLYIKIWWYVFVVAKLQTHISYQWNLGKVLPNLHICIFSLIKKHEMLKYLIFSFQNIQFPVTQVNDWIHFDTVGVRLVFNQLCHQIERESFRKENSQTELHTNICVKQLNMQYLQYKALLMFWSNLQLQMLWYHKHQSIYTCRVDTDSDPWHQSICSHRFTTRSLPLTHQLEIHQVPILNGSNFQLIKIH